MNASTYMVRVSGCAAGTVTTFGTVTNVEKVNMDIYSVTFDTGEVRRMNYKQALVVIEGA